MNPETHSIPIAPATDCCSDNHSAAVETPTSADKSATTSEGCCQSSASTPAATAEAIPSTNASCSSATDGADASPEAAAAEAGEESAPDDAALIDALREVIDPELMINIVDLGLVYSINHTERKVLVEMTLTSPACPAGPQIISQAKMSLEKLSGVDQAEIKLTMTPPWTPDRMTDDARDQLGIF